MDTFKIREEVVIGLTNLYKEKRTQGEEISPIHKEEIRKEAERLLLSLINDNSITLLFYRIID